MKSQLLLTAVLLFSVSAHGQVRIPQPKQFAKTNTPTPQLSNRASAHTDNGTDDIRSVSGTSVNLEPVHKWEISHEGERPLKHWKSVSFNEYFGLINGAHCFTVVVDGEHKTILLQNSPSSILTLANRVRALQIQVGRATFISNQADANATYHQSQVAESWTASGSAEWVNAVAIREAQLKQNAANAKAFAQLTQAQREQVERELMGVTLQFQSTKELAMFTGRVIIQRELWDCGVRKSR